MACAFCATGMLGFARNLKAHEIVEQVLLFMRELKKESDDSKVDNIVFMGMGEPFLNYPEVIKALKWLNDPETFNFGSRRLSISTSGVTEGIIKIGGEKLQINLAVSLHFATDLSRQRYMPIANKYPLDKLFTHLLEAKSKKGKVRIAWYGDSFSDGDILVSDLRDTLQSLYGGNGVGFVPITSQVANRYCFLEQVVSISSAIPEILNI